MDFGLREVLILVGLVVIAGILFDGYRRMRKSKLGELELPTEMGGTCDDDWEFYKGELPNGGARAVKFGEARRAESPFSAEPDDVQPDADFGSALYDSEGEFEEDAVMSERRSRRTELRATDEEAQVDEPSPDAKADLFSDDDLMVTAFERQKTDLDKRTATPQKAEQRKSQDLATEDFEIDPDLQEVIVINIMARDDELKGPELLRVLESCGFRFGEMNIFHRFEQHTGRGQLLFSAANVVEPGVFDPDGMEQLSTPGICIFMKLPGPKRPIRTYDLLMDTARKVANLLDAEIKDEHHNVMRQQTAEHYRQRVLDFERKFLSYKASQKQI